MGPQTFLKTNCKKFLMDPDAENLWNCYLMAKEEIEIKGLGLVILEDSKDLSIGLLDTVRRIINDFRVYNGLKIGLPSKDLKSMFSKNTLKRAEFKVMPKEIMRKISDLAEERGYNGFVIFCADVSWDATFGMYKTDDEKIKENPLLYAFCEAWNYEESKKQVFAGGLKRECWEDDLKYRFCNEYLNVKRQNIKKGLKLEVCLDYPHLLEYRL